MDPFTSTSAPANGDQQMTPIASAPRSPMCTWCRKTGLVLRRAATSVRNLIEGTGTSVLGCDACLSIVEQGLEQRLTVETRTETPLQFGWEQAAKAAADRAALAVRSEHEAAMKALNKDLNEQPAAYWLESHGGCPAWCAHPEAHRSGDHPEDRFHDSESHTVHFDTMEPSTAYAEYLPPEMRMFLTMGYREAEARVAIEFEGDSLAWGSLDETEALAFALLDLVRKARGQESVKVQPYDGHGRCTTKDCTLCHVQATA